MTKNMKTPATSGGAGVPKSKQNGTGAVNHDLVAALEHGREHDPRCGEEPWGEYDDHNVDEIVEGVEVWGEEGALGGIEHVYLYETAHKTRKGVVRACVKALSAGVVFKDFWEWPRWVMELDYGDARRKLVHVALAIHADQFGRCWPKVSTLGEMACGLSMTPRTRKRVVQRHLKELEETGYLRRQYREKPSGQSDSTLYTLLVPDELGRVTPDTSTYRSTSRGRTGAHPEGVQEHIGRVTPTAPKQPKNIQGTSISTSTPRSGGMGSKRKRPKDVAAENRKRKNRKRPLIPPQGIHPSSGRSPSSPRSASGSPTSKGEGVQEHTHVQEHTLPPINRFLQQRRARSSHIPAESNGHG